MLFFYFLVESLNISRQDARLAEQLPGGMYECSSFVASLVDWSGNMYSIFMKVYGAKCGTVVFFYTTLYYIYTRYTFVLRQCITQIHGGTPH